MVQNTIRQILIAGAGTAAWWNAGDEAILCATLQELRAKLPVVKIGVVSANPQGALGVYGVNEIHVSDIAGIIQFAQQSDLLVLGGGGLFYDYWGFTIDNLLTEAQGGAGIYAGFALLATLLNKPLMIYAVGVGPLFSDVGKHYTRLAFEQAHGITVRDNESKELLISLGIHPEKILVTADPVWAFPDIPIDFGKAQIRQMGIPSSSPILGVSMRPWTNPDGDAWESVVAQAMDGFIEHHGGTVIFIPFHKNDGIVDDYAQSEQVRQLMKYADRAYVLDASLSLENKISMLRQCDLVLGMRLHANILAIRYGIPAVGLAYDPKVTNLFNEIGKPDFSLHLRLVSTETLQFVLDQAYKNRDTLRTYYAQRADAMSDLAKENVALAVHVTRANQISNSSLPADTFQWVKSLLREKTLLAGERFTSLNQRISEQQSQIDSLNNQLNALNNQLDALNNQLSTLNNQLGALKGSLSWKITLPLRFLKLFIQNPRGALLKLVQHVLARLPTSFQAKLFPWVQRGKRIVTVIFQKSKGVTMDLTWDEFQSRILSSMDDYKGVFVLHSTIDWNFPLAQRPQPLSLALAKLGYLVIYHTPNQTDHVCDVRQVAQNVWITGVDMERINVKNAVHAVYSTSLITPPGSLKNKREQGQVLVYEYIDHISPMISGDGENIRQLLELKQFAFCGGADFIVASARQLEMEAVKAVGREKVIYVPNGVDVQHYHDPAHQTMILPDHLEVFRQRYQIVVGYFGAIAPWLWHEMMHELVKLRPDLGFVFIGPDYNNGIHHFPKSPNMLYLDAVAYKVLPAYARLFDICLIPFAPGEIARTTSPLKLFEYFALEKPVVVTSFMDECVVYDEVFSGDSAQSISAAIDAAVKIKDDPEYKARLAFLAEQNSWDERAKAYESVWLHKKSQPDNNAQDLLPGVETK